MEDQTELVGKTFVGHYYHLFDNDRASLSSLYQPTSMLTFEGQNFFGVDDISTKFNQLPFDQCRHMISTIDSQPCPSTGGLLIFVSGSLQLAGEDHHLRFSQVMNFTSLHFTSHHQLWFSIYITSICQVTFTVLYSDIKLSIDIKMFNLQMFHLIPTPRGSFAVQNDIFRLNYG